MAGRRATFAIVAVIVLAAGSTTAYAVSTLTQDRSTRHHSGIGTFRAVPRRWLVRDEMRFTPLSPAEMSRVTVTATTAVHVAEAGFALNKGVHVVFESLGGYVDSNQIVHDWVGTHSWIPPVTLAYFVRLAGVDIPALGRQLGADHHADVIVNAVSGREICATSFN